MNKLIEIAELVKTINLKSTDLIINQRENKTQYQEFFQKLIQRDFGSDQEAASYFFDLSSTSSKYKNLKRYLKQKMISQLFFIEPKKNYGEYNQAYIFCSKNMFAAKLLLNFGARSSGIELCLKVFKKALQVDLTEFIVGASRYLRLHYGIREGNIEKFEYFDNAFKKYSKILEAENLAEEKYIFLMLPLVDSVSVNTDLAKKAKDSYLELSPYLERFESPVLHFYGNYLKILSALFSGDYYTLIDDCHCAITFFESREYKFITPLRVFYNNLLTAYTQLKEYKKGKLAAEKASQLVISGTHSWYANKELHLILAFHSREYQEAMIILKEALLHKKFRFLNSTVKEKWLLYRGYAHLSTYYTEIKEPDYGLGEFKLGRFLNSIPIFSKDKRGLNIAILNLQILILIFRRDYSKAIDRFDALKKYASRYISKKEHFRSHCFMKMLFGLESGRFHKAGVLRKTSNWFEKLQSAPLNIVNQPYEIEIIPYEELWKHVIVSLGNKPF